jgi:hypothetical protein
MRRRFRAILRKLLRWLPVHGATDHPSNGGLTGEDYPDEDSDDGQ